MAVSIDQKPLYETFPVGQQVVFSISLDSIVATMFKVKFVAEVHISNKSSSLISAATKIGTFKTTPNNKGVGIFDFSSVLETFLKPDHQGSTFENGSRYKTSTSPSFNYIPTHPIHLINKCAVSENSMRYLAFAFKIEYATTSDGAVVEPDNETTSISYKIFNGVLQYDDVLTLDGNDYGYNIDSFILDDTSNPGKFLSNAPTTQYARLTDYGTFPFFNFLPAGNVDRVYRLHFRYYNSAGALLDSEDINTGWGNGGVTTNVYWIFNKLMYCGVFPGNLRNWSSIFETAITNDLSYYTVVAEDATSGAAGEVSERYRINIICPNERGYEGIRLTWLNQWGVWDYYTFNMKSTRALTTNRTSYTQLGGTWNESTFKVAGYKGGKKNFRVNSTEKITLNTDFVTEAEGVWFEELINSTEVYILNGFDGTEVAPYPTITNKYVEPVVLTTSSYVKKTVANDKLMQYTIEIEKSKMKRTQSV
jgi:hypothetical protein